MSIQQEEGQQPLAVQGKAAVVLPCCLRLCLTAFHIYKCTLYLLRLHCSNATFTCEWKQSAYKVLGLL